MIASVTEYFSSEKKVPERKLGENSTFERIIECINRGDGYVYSASTTKYYLSLGKDGTEILEYLKTLDEETIDFKGPITAEQAQAAGIFWIEGSTVKMSLLEYLIAYFANNKNNQNNTTNFACAAQELIKKGISFDIELMKKAKLCGINLIDMWAGESNVKMADTAANVIYNSSLSFYSNYKKLEAIIFHCFSSKPIEDIFPDCLYHKHLAGHIELFISAIEERVCVASKELEAKKPGANLSMPSDFTVSFAFDTLMESATNRECIKALEAEVLKLNYALNAAKIKLASDKLFEAEKSLASLIAKKERKRDSINTTLSTIKQTDKEIESMGKEASLKEKALDDKISNFKKTWFEKKILDTQAMLSRDNETNTMAVEKQTYDSFLGQLEKKKASLERVKASVNEEIEKLTQFSKSIAEAESKAKELATHYTKLVKEKPEVNPMGNCITKGVGTQKTPTDCADLNKLLYNSTISMEQKVGTMFLYISLDKWENVCTVLSSGFLPDGFKSTRQDTVLAALARRYKESLPSEILLVLAHISPEGLTSIKGDGVKNYCGQYFCEAPVIKYLRGNNDKEFAVINK